MMAQKGSDWLTLEEAAKLLDKSVSALRYYINAGYIRSYRKPGDRHVYVSYGEVSAFSEQEPQPQKKSDE